MGCVCKGSCLSNYRNQDSLVWHSLVHSLYIMVQFVLLLSLLILERFLKYLILFPYFVSNLQIVLG